MAYGSRHQRSRLACCSCPGAGALEATTDLEKGQGHPVRSKVCAAALVGVLALAASGCSRADIDTWRRGGLPAPASDRATHVLSLWQGAWIAALLVGCLV